MPPFALIFNLLMVALVFWGLALVGLAWTLDVHPKDLNVVWKVVLFVLSLLFWPAYLWIAFQWLPRISVYERGFTWNEEAIEIANIQGVTLETNDRLSGAVTIRLQIAESRTLICSTISLEESDLRQWLQWIKAGDPSLPWSDYCVTPFETQEKKSIPAILPIFLSIIVYATVIYAMMQDYGLWIAAFGKEPFGIPVRVVVCGGVTILYLPYLYVFWHLGKLANPNLISKQRIFSRVIIGLGVAYLFGIVTVWHFYGKAVGLNPKPGRAFNELDVNGDGRLTPNELGHVWEDFASADTDGDGGVTIQEIVTERIVMERKLIGRVGQEVPFMKLDINEDGVITSNEVRTRTWSRLAQADADDNDEVTLDEIVAKFGSK